jgi:hypothetical protein
MDGRGDHGESAAIIGMACRFPGARDPAEFHDLAVAGRDMFQPVAALPGRPLRAALTQALAALFTAGALTDLTPFLPTASAGEEGRAGEGGIGGGREISGSTLASRTVPRMRAAEEAGPSGPAPAGAVSCDGAGNPARSVT